MAFEGKVVWVTGASSGIGEALSRQLLDRGAYVILSGRQTVALGRVAANAPQRALVLPFEATNWDALPDVVDEAWNWHGAIDILVNNAGISQRSLAVDTQLPVYRALMEVDYLAPVALTQLVLPRMIERGFGHIAAVSSVAGKIGVPLRTGYCGAKHAVVGYFSALRAEIESAHGIAVTVILPGSVKTPIAINAVEGNGERRGRSDPNIERGIDVNIAAGSILEGIAEQRREVVVADGMEGAALQIMRDHPEKLYEITRQEGARLANMRNDAGPGMSLDSDHARLVQP
ncbi:SDR family NAD(P)-dependent oxidoreductase [Paraburkholderia sp. CNPSo 3272]|uniref:SDR family NAD(P)-dependent oxidoreductase n=1 Tax=Paraburkholderia sp. CNPSo 3272 TaxID=2940931 RepID=UPI0020B67DE5|nr:SDR family NAD(P)-dependent oxidoreductase [Paraburkholderia sp. CNPSo 3272]MCP3728083.1 SDR family NAD(P)-dependent oxidoreductase [Paraburkholderia sp. CNPSo 3272]